MKNGKKPIYAFSYLKFLKSVLLEEFLSSMNLLFPKSDMLNALATMTLLKIFC